MATLFATSLELRTLGDYSTAACKKEQAKMEKLEATAKALPDSVMKGRIIKFGVADGYASYLVKSEKPLILQHINFCDNYAIPISHIRGIRLSDVRKWFAAGPGGISD